MEDIVGQHYMTYPERIRLETMLKYKVPISQIARDLSFSRQTIYNEIRRGEYKHVDTKRGWTEHKTYSADKGQRVHEKAIKNKGSDLKIGKDIAYANFLEEKILKEKRSPAAALAEARAAGFTTTICKTTFYTYIDQGIFYALTNNDLWEKPHRRKKAEKPKQRIAHPKLPSIESRPAHIGQRQDLGHWELDLIVGKHETTAALMVMTERVTRQIIIRKIPNKKASTIVGELNKLERSMPDFRSRIQTITTDNGPEFLDYEGMRRSIHNGERCEVYYCHSYASWEKGTTERNNRIVRRFFPKGTDFTKVTKKQVAAVQDWMNNYPRKILNWMTPNQMAA